MNPKGKRMNKTKIALKKLLSEHLGIEVEDIKDEDFLRDDLHMTSAEISDFLHMIAKKYDIEFDDITLIETFQDIVDEISENSEL